MTNFTIPYARYTGLVDATGMAKFRTISGLPARRHLYTTALFIIAWTSTVPDNEEITTIYL